MYEEIREEYEDFEDRDYSDYADYKYDMMRDDFLMIDSEESAKDCIERYPSMVGKYMPEQYRYLLKENK